MQVRAQLRTLLTDALLWALLVVLVMATAGALVVRSLFRRALANVSATALAIAGGNFTQRVRLTGRGDEFDQLAETINDMLDRIGPPDGRRARSVERDRTRPAHTDHPGAGATGRGAAHAGTAGRAALRHRAGDQPISMASLQCSRRCCGSPRSRPAHAASAFATVDLAPVLADAAELYGAVAEEKGVALSVEEPEPCLPMAIAN